MIKESHTYAEWNWQLVGLCWSSACIDLLVWALNVWNQAFKVCSWWWRSLFSFFLLPISGPLPPFLFFCQLHQFSPLSLLPLPLAFLYDQKSKPLKTLSDQCRTVDTDSLLTATAAPSVCTQTDINHYRLDLEVCANTCMCVCVGVAFALFKWILPDSWYDWWQYKRWRWRGGGVYAKSCESAHMHLFPHSYSQSCRWAVPLGL